MIGVLTLEDRRFGGWVYCTLLLKALCVAIFFFLVPGFTEDSAGTFLIAGLGVAGMGMGAAGMVVVVTTLLLLISKERIVDMETWLFFVGTALNTTFACLLVLATILFLGSTILFLFPVAVAITGIMSFIQFRDDVEAYCGGGLPSIKTTFQAMFLEVAVIAPIMFGLMPFQHSLV